MVSLKTFSLFLCIVATLLGYAIADPFCSKNAWILLTNNGIRGGAHPAAWGSVQITSGKQAMDISWSTMQNAIVDCLFKSQYCTWDGYNYECETIPAWIRSDWHATLNIEFSCADGDYACYDPKWY